MFFHTAKKGMQAGSVIGVLSALYVSRSRTSFPGLAGHRQQQPWINRALVRGSRGIIVGPIAVWGILCTMAGTMEHMTAIGIQDYAFRIAHNKSQNTLDFPFFAIGASLGAIGGSALQRGQLPLLTRVLGGAAIGTTAAVTTFVVYWHTGGREKWQ